MGFFHTKTSKSAVYFYTQHVSFWASHISGLWLVATILGSRDLKLVGLRVGVLGFEWCLTLDLTAR